MTGPTVYIESYERSENLCPSTTAVVCEIVVGGVGSGIVCLVAREVELLALPKVVGVAPSVKSPKARPAGAI